MSKIVFGEHTPTEEDHKFVENLVNSVEGECFPKHKVEEVKDWDKFKEAEEKYLKKGGVSVYKPQTFYQSKYFPFHLETDKFIYYPSLKRFTTEVEFQKFIKNNRYLVYRCIKGTNMCGVGETFAVYYHYDFGKISWLKNKLQFVINKLDLPKDLIIWYYNIKNIPRHKLDIKLRFNG